MLKKHFLLLSMSKNVFVETLIYVLKICFINTVEQHLFLKYRSLLSLLINASLQNKSTLYVCLNKLAPPPPLKSTFKKFKAEFEDLYFVLIHLNYS